MKKKALKSIVLTAVMVMALSMSACGSKEADAPADANEVEEAAGTEDEKLLFTPKPDLGIMLNLKKILYTTNRQKVQNCG